MIKPWKIYTFLIGFVVTLGVGVYGGYYFFHASAPSAPVVNAQVILTALRDRGFLVTQTYVYDEPVTIDKNSGNVFKDFFLGQTITARGAMEVNLGIDLSKVTADDVTVNGDTVTVMIPPATVFNVRLAGPLNIQNDQGILKKLVQNDDGYNEAQAELSKVAQQTAEQPDNLKSATNNAIDQISRLLGYVAQGKTINVQVKQ